MSNLRDLKIEKEVFPLFDHTLNMFSARKVLELLQTPLVSTEEILERQHIFKGFSANAPVLSEYSYTVLSLNEVHYFTNDEKIETLNHKFRYRFLTSEKEKSRSRSKFHQLVVFFHRLESRYFRRLKLDPFPHEYQLKIRRILDLLSVFELQKYENIVREHRLKDRHIFELTAKLSTLRTSGRLGMFWEDLFEFEAFLSLNTGILRNNFAFPVFSPDGIKLSGFYHPLIADAVRNDLETSGNVIVLNGPNMSGKSTALKAIALCAYLGNLGLGVPASRAEIPFFEHFSIGINRRDDILNGYSHFMTEIMDLKNVVEEAQNGRKCFAVFDELFSGTNVEDALEICRTTIKGLSKFENSYFFISTHLQELKELSDERVSNYFIDCELIGEKPVFTYKLKKGWSEIRVGRLLFEKEGLNSLLQ